MDSKQTQLGGAAAGTRPATAGDPRSAEQIARDIATRRAEMNVLADALEERLAPKQIASEVSHAVKKQLQSRTHRAASAMARSVRHDPFPWLLMGLGAAWLVKERRERAHAPRLGAAKRGVGGADPLLGVSSYGSMGYGASASAATLPGAAQPLESAVPPPTATGVHEILGEPEPHGLGAVAEKASAARERVAEKTHEVRERVGEAAHAAKERVVETAHAAGERTRETAHRARVGLAHQAESNPLLLGLAVLAGGVALGAALPATRKEEELLGPVRDRLFDQARESGREVAGRVSRVAEVAVSSAADRLEGESSSADLGRLASSAARAAGQAARREAAQQGLSPGTHGATVPGGSGGGPLAPPGTTSPGAGATGSLGASRAGSSLSGAPGFASGAEGRGAGAAPPAAPARGYDPRRDPRES